MTFLTCDIETVPQAQYVDPLTAILDGGWVEEHAGSCIADEIMAGQAKLAATKCAPALHATTCHVVQVSFGKRKENGDLERRVFQSDDYRKQVDEDPDPGLIGRHLSDVSEKFLLLDAFKYLHWAGSKRLTLVGFNSKEFDLPLLRARAAILRLDVPRLGWSGTRGLLYPYSDETHCDIRLLLNHGDRRAPGTLQHWAEAFGIHAEEHGAEVWGWVQAGEWQKLRDYGMVEAQTLVEFYEALRKVA